MEEKPKSGEERSGEQRKKERTKERGAGPWRAEKVSGAADTGGCVLSDGHSPPDPETRTGRSP